VLVSMTCVGEYYICWWIIACVGENNICVVEYSMRVGEYSMCWWALHM
jgi:hypothetical protein